MIPIRIRGRARFKNKFGIADSARLERLERLYTTDRAADGVSHDDFDFDLAHLKAIHRHLFQDVFDWAGDNRTLEIAKGGNRSKDFFLLRTA